MNKTKSWHNYSIKYTKDYFRTDIYKGLSDDKVSEYQTEYGLNILERGSSSGVISIVLKQFKSPLVFILLIAGIITIFLREFTDSIVIFIALLINVVIGTLQEERADKAFEKLNKSRQKYATVIRGGSKSVISAEQLVPGDLIIIETGMYIPADSRIISANGLGVNESALTGEWVEVPKEVANEKKEAPITEQFNMVWMGTLVTAGEGRAIVVATGGDTQIGSIAKSLSGQVNMTTHLQKSIKEVAKYLTYLILFSIVIIFIIGLARGMELESLFLIGIAIAVAAMPEGLPAAVTVVLALGMENILKNKGLIRNLLAAETLGSTTVILTDKTGTLTKAEMRISSIITTGVSNNDDLNNKDSEIANNSDEKDILAMAVLSSDAFVEGYNDTLSEWIVRGRPVERAIILAGLESGLKKENLLNHNQELDSIPFTSERRYAAALYRSENTKKQRIYISGAPEILLENATKVYIGGKNKIITKKIREKLVRAQKENTDQGMRVIALAFKDVDWEEFPKGVKEGDDDLLKELVFGGFLVISDPVRREVPQSIKKVREAGTRVIMLTGDNVNTARRVAIEVGISKVGGKALEGVDIEGMSDKELLQALKEISVFARVLPHQKMRIVTVLKKNKEVVAMTGDGINDAPAIRRADIGIALGSGTEVAKEASDMILLNNSFSIIVSAIEEGRRILDNLKKIVMYLLSTSFSEIFLVGGALMIGTPLPLLPAQILWTNIIEEGFMNFSFAFEPKEEDVMRRNPKSASMKSIITPRLRSIILILSLVTGVFVTAIYFLLLQFGLRIEEIRTIMFALLSVDSLFFSFSLKDLSKPIWRINIFSNRYLIVAILISVATLIAALYLPILQKLLSLTPINSSILALVFVVGIINLLIIELIKYFYFERKNKSE